MTTVLVLLATPLLAAAVYAAAGWRPATRWAGTLGCGVVLGAALVLATDVGTGPVPAVLGGLARVDALSAYLLVVIGAVALLAVAATPAHFAVEIAAGRATARTAARHHVLVQLFVFSMAAAVLAADLAVLWIMIEATTVCTAFLVGQRRTRASVEAAWKYVVVCSTGIALALLGTLILEFAAHHAGGTGLDLAALVALGPRLDPDVTRLAVALLLLGFGTKIGLAPLHAWLPDAHSQAPAPVSALMSGVLLSVAAYAVLRVVAVSDAALGPGFASALLATTAVATLALVATLLLAQRDLKRMLAYSSMEHMALVTLGAAIGTRAAVAAALLHVLGHGLAKAALFVGSGRVLQLTGSSRIADVRGLAARDPALAGCLAAGFAALLGFPPFLVFATQLGIVRAGFAAGPLWAAVTAAALVLVLVIGAALVRHAGRMLLGVPRAVGAAAGAGGGRQSHSPDGTRQHGGSPDTGDGGGWPGGRVTVLVAGLAACAVLGVWAGPLQTLVLAAADVVGAR